MKKKNTSKIAIDNTESKKKSEEESDEYESSEED